VGESSAVGESFSAGTVRSASPSILSNYKWVHKALQVEVGCADPGSAPKVACEAATGMGVTAKGSCEVDESHQTAPVVLLGRHGEPTEPGATLASPCMPLVIFDDFSSGPTRAEQFANESQKMQEGGTPFRCEG
jgi:hypothetical protein